MIDPKEMIDALILQGALEIEGIDPETGEMVFSMTDKMKDIAPELYVEYEEALYRSVMSLWEKGFVVMNVMDEQPVVSPSEFALDRATWKALPPEELNVMKTLMMRFEGEI